MIRSAVLAATLLLVPIAVTPEDPVQAPVPASAALPAVSSPPMGWNSWNKFACDIDETLIRQTADALVSTGMAAAGYTYVNLDDCWMASTRDAAGNLRADPTRFPGGIKALADYVHGKGLKFGIYQSAGTMTCEERPGSLDYEVRDATLFASWGVDYLKYDNCYNAGRPALERYRAMGDALRATGRPIVYSICNWGESEPWVFGNQSGGQLWRTTGDISDSWNSMTGILDQQAGLEPFARPGAWNDPDMLEVGNGGMTDAEYRAHFSLWALLNAPLIAGQDVRSTNQATRDILLNQDVIAVDQDWGGSQGRRVRDDGDREVWAKPMSDGSVAVALFNRTGAAATISASAAEAGLGGSTSYALKDLWTKATSTSTGTISAAVPSHGVVFYRVSRAGSLQAAPAAGTHQVSDLPWLASGNGWGPAERDRSNGEQGAADGRGLTIGGTAYPKGVGAHADSAVHVYLGGRCSTFTARVGIDGESGNRGSVRFQVYGDGRYLASARTTGGRAAVPIAVDVAGFRTLELRATDGRDGKDYDHADWADAQVTCAAGATRSIHAADTALTGTGRWGPVERDRANGEQHAGDAAHLTAGGTSYARGLGTHAPSTVTIPVPAGCTRFRANAGVDAEVGGLGSVTVTVAADGVTLFTSPVLRGGAAGSRVDVDVTGRQQLTLSVTDGGDGIDWDHADWADATFAC